MPTRGTKYVYRTGVAPVEEEDEVSSESDSVAVAEEEEEEGAEGDAGVEAECELKRTREEVRRSLLLEAMGVLLDAKAVRIKVRELPR